MNMSKTALFSGLLIASSLGASAAATKLPAIYDPACGEGYYILTPPLSEMPSINGPDVFGVRPGNPFSYTVPVTGLRPMNIAVEGLPAGLSIDNKGIISGMIKDPALRNYTVQLIAENALGRSKRNLEIQVGEEICLTPPMGWSSWIATKKTVSQEKVLENARDFIERGFQNYGYSYINIDDAWQGPSRGGEFNAIQPNLTTFPDIKKMADEIHAMGLKVGIYSTPWISSYAKFIGGSSNNKEGRWDPSMIMSLKNASVEGRASLIGKYRFDANDAAQWAAWGMDYMKYDWNPNEGASIISMAKALRASGRDIVFSISNSCPMSEGENCEKHVQVFRTGGDIRARWDSEGSHWNLRENWDHHKNWLVDGFAGKPGHIPDPDFLMVGLQKYGSKEAMTADELYHHVSSYVLWGAPLLMSCTLENLDAFEMNLLTNLEMLEINQDRLARPASCVYDQDGIEVLVKELADGGKAIGIFNFNKQSAVATIDWKTLGLSGSQTLRDVWRQKDIGKYDVAFSTRIRPHGVIVVRTAAEK